MSGFTINTTALAQAGQAISGHSDSVQAIQQQISKAEVPATAWGQLGVMLGLVPGYLSLLASLEANMKQMGAHLDQTGSALAGVAQAYRDIEDGFATAFADLQDGLSGTGA